MNRFRGVDVLRKLHTLVAEKQMDRDELIKALTEITAHAMLLCAAIGVDYHELLEHAASEAMAIVRGGQDG